MAFVIVRNRLISASSALVIALLSGCGTIPDLKPFADATADLRTGVSGVGTEYSALIPSSLRCADGEPCSEQFDKAWAPSVAAMKAIATYSDSLAQIADAARTAEQSSEKVAGAAQALLGALGASPLSAPIIAAVKKGLTEIAKERAMRSLDQSIDAVHPLISEVVNIFDADLSALRSSVHRVANSGKSALQKEEPANTSGAAVLGLKTNLQKQISALQRDYTRLSNLAEQASILRADKQCIGGAQPCPELVDINRQLVAVNKAVIDGRAAITLTEQQLQSAEKMFAPTKVQLEQIDLREKKAQATLAKLRTGLQDWIALHRDLGHNVRNSLRPDVRSLLTTGNEIRKLIEDIRDSK